MSSADRSYEYLRAFRRNHGFDAIQKVMDEFDRRHSIIRESQDDQGRKLTHYITLGPAKSADLKRMFDEYPESMSEGS